MVLGHAPGPIVSPNCHGKRAKTARFMHRSGRIGSLIEGRRRTSWQSVPQRESSAPDAAYRVPRSSVGPRRCPSCIFAAMTAVEPRFLPNNQSLAVWESGLGMGHSVSSPPAQHSGRLSTRGTSALAEHPALGTGTEHPVHQSPWHLRQSTLLAHERSGTSVTTVKRSIGK